ncbi:MAG TPA: DNA repair protein RecN [Spirochaetia bacterium]|nr:DNA repair protein RecN [Spirochaetia bacterium]
MLEEIVVQNYALIDRITVHFGKGLNVLTGETGAGKSILIGALSLLFGAKGEADAVRTGAEEAVVSGVVRADANGEALSWLKLHDIAPEEGTVIIRRVLKRAGRGSLFIQSTPVTRQDLEELTSFLFDMHGQHEHQSLLNRENQRLLLDRYGGTEERAGELASMFAAVTALKRRYEKLVSSERSQLREMDLLSFAINEIDGAALREGEEEELETERTILSQYEKMYTLLDTIHEKTADSKGGSLSLLRDARTAMDGIVVINPELSNLAKRLEDAFFEIEDVSEEVRRYQLSVQFSPDRLEEAESRLALIHRLEKKYGGTVREVLAYAAESKEQLASVENWQEDKSRLETEIAAGEKRLLAAAEALSKLRKSAAEGLTKLVSEKLLALGMPKARYVVDVSPRTNENGKVACGSSGIDQIEFMISPNTGEPLKPLRAIASGGELSRIMLAIKSVISETDHIGSLIFDEIDTGIGGEVGVAVGEHLRGLSEHKQVLCITHLASIAVCADNHIKVEKYVKGERTYTGVQQVTGPERVREVARMLAGDSADDVSLQHAEDLLKRYSPEATRRA